MSNPGWGAVARAYARYWSPRFRPFLERALAAFAPGPGPLLVPGCGPGEELVELARRFPGRALVGSDPSARMLVLARRALRQAGLSGRVALRRAGAEEAPPALGGVFSSFVLQLLPDPAAALRAWAAALAPEGQALALFWPRQPEETPWGRLGRVLEREADRPRSAAEDELLPRLADLGLELEASLAVTAPVRHRDPEEAWDQLVQGCSLHALARRVGPERLAACRRAWLAEHGLTPDAAGWAHQPVARLWLLRPRRG